MHENLWKWSDLDRPRGPWGLFALSGEFLTTLLLWGYTAVLLAPGATVTQTPALAVLAEASRGKDWPWAAVAFALSIVAPIAVWLDAGRLRLLSLVLQGAFFALLGWSGFVNFRLSLGWITFALCGAYLLGRALNFAWPHLVVALTRLLRVLRLLAADRERGG